MTDIKSIDDVRQFAKELIAEGLNFHPDDDFNDYVNIESNQPTYNEEEADIRNILMNKCFKVCEENEIDIYEVMMDELFPAIGINKEA